jgi:catechol 2,3-dioxygenase-like lactoylglutathione lyase family enzyme
MATLQGFHHVKLPVTDVERSRDWYTRTLGFAVELDFVEDGVLMGVALRDPSGTVPLALRCDPDRAKAMSGFDPIAIGVPTDADVERWRDRLTELGEPHGGIVTGHLGPVLVGLRDPDGIEVRLYTMGGAS